MEVHFDESTGIYRRWHVRASTAAGMMEVFSAMADVQNRHYHDRLDETEEAAEEAISQDALGSHIKDARCRAEFVSDVRLADATCRSIRRLLDAGDDEGAVNEAILLGTIIERAGVRAHEANAGTGARNRAGGLRGAEIAHGTPEVREAKRQAIVDAWTAMRSKFPAAKAATIDDLVSEDLVKAKAIQDVSAPTVKRARLRK